eukprot:m.94465 g.94465  ORF g.94465 m.94465 type:complete len:328 (+) comp10049_c0_seq4:118-1101(+)
MSVETTSKQVVWGEGEAHASDEMDTVSREDTPSAEYTPAYESPTGTDDVDPFSITEVSTLQTMLHDALSELDLLRGELDTSAEQEAMMSMTTTTHLTKLVAENLNLRNELVACKAAIAELEFQKEQLRLRLRRGDVFIPLSKTSVGRGQALANKLKWGIGRVFHKDQLGQGGASAAHGGCGGAPSALPVSSGGSRHASLLPSNTKPNNPSSHSTVSRGTPSAADLGHECVLTRRSTDDSWGIDVDSTVDDEGAWVHMVLAVQRGSAAHHTGITPGEVLVSVNGKSTLELDHMQLVEHFQVSTKELKVRVCNCDDLVGTLQRPALTLL